MAHMHSVWCWRCCFYSAVKKQKHGLPPLSLPSLSFSLSVIWSEWLSCPVSLVNISAVQAPAQSMSLTISANLLPLPLSSFHVRPFILFSISQYHWKHIIYFFVYLKGSQETMTCETFFISLGMDIILQLYIYIYFFFLNLYLKPWVTPWVLMPHLIHHMSYTVSSLIETLLDKTLLSFPGLGLNILKIREHFKSWAWSCGVTCDSFL